MLTWKWIAPLVVILVLVWLICWAGLRDPVLALLAPAGVLLLLVGGAVASAVLFGQFLATTQEIRSRHPDGLVFLGYTFIPSFLRRSQSWRVPLTALADLQGIRLISGDESQPSTTFTWNEIKRLETGLVQALPRPITGLTIVANDPARSVGLQVGGPSFIHQSASTQQTSDLIRQLEELREKSTRRPTSESGR